MRIKPTLNTAITGLFTSVTIQLSILPATATTFKECVQSWKIELPGLSTDQALQQCQKYGLPAKEKIGESKGKCINRAYETLDLAFYKTEASKIAQEFCASGGQSSCLSSAYRTFDLAFYKTEAVKKAFTFCVNGGSSSCLSESYILFDRSLYKVDAAKKASDFCIKN